MEARIAINALLQNAFDVTLWSDDRHITRAAIRAAYNCCGAENLAFADEEARCFATRRAFETIKARVDGLFAAIRNHSFDYPAWHNDVCTALRAHFVGRTAGDAFTYGIAQNWVNGTLYNLCMIHAIYRDYNPTSRFFRLYNVPICEVLPYLHVTIDDYTLQNALNGKAMGHLYGFDLTVPNGEEEAMTDWRTWDCSEADWAAETDTYHLLQKALRSAVAAKRPTWEMPTWEAFTVKEIGHSLAAYEQQTESDYFDEVLGEGEE